MREAIRLVGIRMKGIAREIRTITAELHLPFLGTWVDTARPRDNGTLAVYFTASLADRVFLRNAKLLRDTGPDLLILVCQVHDTVEAGQTARCCHLLVVHFPPGDRSTTIEYTE